MRNRKQRRRVPVLLPTEAEVDRRFGLEPVFEVQGAHQSDGQCVKAVTVGCPYCGEAFNTDVDLSAGACSYVEDCQVCCQPIEISLAVNQDGSLQELLAQRGD